MSKLEIACCNHVSAIVAFENGADRIELCDGFEKGGTTPEFELTKGVRKRITIPIYVMIRPRGGDFLYTNAEFEQMKADIIKYKTLNIDGFVFGILDEKHQVNIKILQLIISQLNEYVVQFLTFVCQTIQTYLIF